MQIPAEEKISESIENSSLYQALLESGTDPEKSKILAENYLLRYPKPFRRSINSIVSEY